MSYHSSVYLESLAKARALAEKGWNTAEKEEAIALANQALKLNPDCAEAYILLGSRKAPTFEEALAYAHQAKEAARRAIGSKEEFQKYHGEFWRTPETQSYLKALEATANIEWIRNDYVKSNEAYKEMLELSPIDDQGARYPYSDGLVKLEQYDELECLLCYYNGDIACTLSYNKALMLFKRDGPTEAATLALDEAIDRNGFVPQYLLGRKRFPRTLPPLKDFGDEAEAIDYALTNIKMWRAAVGSMRWVRKRIRDREALELDA